MYYLVIFYLTFDQKNRIVVFFTSETSEKIHNSTTSQNPSIEHNFTTEMFYFYVQFEKLTLWDIYIPG